MNPDILHSILCRLNWVNSDRFAAVCTSWRAVAKAHRSIPSSSSAATAALALHPEEPPCLLLPSVFLKRADPDPKDDGRRCLFSLQENRPFQLKNNETNVVAAAGPAAVGSSHGWLIFRPPPGKETEHRGLQLFNPMSKTRIQLPYLGDHSVSKAILSEDPDRSSDGFWVIAIYGDGSKLAAVKSGDCGWTEVVATGYESYGDVVCCKNHLLALTVDGSVHSWELRPRGLVKRGTISAPFPATAEGMGAVFMCNSEDKDLYSTKIYLVESPGGELLLAVRVIGEYVSDDGTPVREADLLTDEDTHPLVFPYRTMYFKVFRLDLGSETWVGVESMGDSAIFVGGGESAALSCRNAEGIRGNSVYFTDDYWERVNEDYLYGGHDSGVFSLKDGSVTAVHDDLDLNQVKPPPFWFTPNTW